MGHCVHSARCPVIRQDRCKLTRACCATEGPLGCHPQRLWHAHTRLSCATEGPLSERLADIDSETGPGGEGALGGEPEVALVLLSLGGSTADSESLQSHADLAPANRHQCCARAPWALAIGRARPKSSI